MPANFSLHIIMLAAGSGSRFGGSTDIKQLASLGRHSLIEHVLMQVGAVSNDGLTLVLGANAKPIQAHLQQAGFTHIHYLFNANWEEGMGSSIACAVSSLPSECSHVLICLADQVALQARDYQALAVASAQKPDNIICSEYIGDGQQRVEGVPAIFPKHFFAELKQIQGDKGAKVLIKALSAHVKGIELSRASIDIDTLDSLKQYLG